MRKYSFEKINFYILYTSNIYKNLLLYIQHIKVNVRYGGNRAFCI